MRVASLCALALALLWVVAELLPSARVTDATLLRHFTLLGESPMDMDGVARFLLDLVSPRVLAFWCLALALFALARGRPREALAVALVVALAPLSAEVLMPLLAHPRAGAGTMHIDPASWPSRRATAALALALCATLLAPSRARLLVAFAGGAFALAIGCAVLIQGWHMPSEVLGGYLLAVVWTALAVAALRAGERRRPARAIAGG